MHDKIQAGLQTGCNKQCTSGVKGTFIIALKLMSVVKLLWLGIIITEDIKVILHWSSSGLSMDGTTGNIFLGSVTKAAH